MNKKGIELTLNTMIIAILVLIASAVILAIFFGGVKGVGEWFRGTSSCVAQGGTCEASASACTGQAIPRNNCDESHKGAGFCCLQSPNDRR